MSSSSPRSSRDMAITSRRGSASLSDRWTITGGGGDTERVASGVTSVTAVGPGFEETGRLSARASCAQMKQCGVHRVVGNYSET